MTAPTLAEPLQTALLPGPDPVTDEATPSTSDPILELDLHDPDTLRRYATRVVPAVVRGC